MERAELYASDETCKAITFHDLRVTGITWMAVRGDEPLRIMQRAGHTSFETTQGYIREAENLRAGFGTVFPPLPTSRLAHSMGQVTRLVPKNSMISVELTGIETVLRIPTICLESLAIPITHSRPNRAAIAPLGTPRYQSIPVRSTFRMVTWSARS